MALKQIAYKIWQSYGTVEGSKLRRLKKTRRFVSGEIVLRGTVWYYCDAPSFAWQFEEIIKRGIYNFKSNSASPRIIDCGANIGTSVLFFVKKFPQARITAFEPDDQIFACLQKNMQSHSCKNVELKNAAVYNHNGQLGFSAQGADGGRLNAESKQAVTCIRLKELLNERIDFLKIDIEGAETAVIVDCVEELKNVQNCFIEYHGFETATDELHTVLTCLHSAGLQYCLESVTVHHQQPFINRVGFDGFKNLINIYAWR